MYFYDDEWEAKRRAAQDDENPDDLDLTDFDDDDGFEDDFEDDQGEENNNEEDNSDNNNNNNDNNNKNNKNDNQGNEGEQGQGDQTEGEQGQQQGEQTQGEQGQQSQGEQTQGQQPQGEQSQGAGENLNGDQVKNDLTDLSNGEGGEKGKGPDGNGKGSEGKTSGTEGSNTSTPQGSSPQGGTPQGGAPQGGAPGGTPPATPPPGAETAAANAGANAGAAGAAGAEGAAAAGTTASAGAASGAAAGAGGAAAGGAAAGGAAAGAGAATGGAAIAALGVVLFWVAIVILIIIVVVGFIFFIISMPGQVMEKLNQLGEDFLDAMQGVIHGTEDIVKGEDIAEVANYLESMGYDLKGEGFINDDITKDSSVSAPENSYKDDDQGVYRDNDSDKVVLADSSPIRIYLISDNLCYIIKNFNTNLDAATGGHGVLATIGAIAATIIVGILFSPAVAVIALVGATALFVASGNPDWGSGLISIYHEGSALGKRGSAYSEMERGYIELDANTKKLKIKRGWTNNAYVFDIEGWSGRYGMPLEFLLSVHIATQMPDLAMEMATTFDTDVEVLLHSVDNGSITAGIKVGDNSYVEWGPIKDASLEGVGFFGDLWNGILDLGDNNWFSWWNADKHKAYDVDHKAVMKIIELGIPRANDCSCCSHINPNNTPGEGETEACADEDTNLDPNSDDFDIGDHHLCEQCSEFVQKVVSALKNIQDNHWYSYTPYISQVTDHWFRDVYFVMENPTDTDVVEVDEDYFYETNERWTMYETYSETDTIPEGFEVGDYKLYEYKEDGTYVLSTRTKEEVDALNEELQAGSPDAIKLIKKSTSTNVSANSGSRWLAYEQEADSQIDWTELKVSEESPEILQDEDLKGLLYYKESRPGDVKQIEDGQRGVTNPTIKNMFVNKAYYHYDGTVEKANRINEDRKATADYRDQDNTDSDKRDTALISKVALAKDSLGAFSILENTHTLDADYIYRDFKELIVELNYFDKEDLSDKIDSVMQWPIPDCGSTGWPLRKYEKSEVFYGTLINSKVDLELMTNADIEAAEELLNELNEEAGIRDDTTITATGSVPAGSVSDLVAKGYEVHKVMEGNNWHYCVGTSWKEGSGGQPHMAKLCPSKSTCNQQHCDTLTAGEHHDCGLDATIQEAEAGHHNTCCATFTSWALKEAGFDLSNHPNMHGAKSSYDWCKAEGWTPITDYSQLEPGDLLFNKAGYTGTDVANIGHVQLLGDNGEWLNAGGVTSINGAPYTGTPNFIIGMRSKMNGAAELFEGYKPEQTVVSPVTGKIIERGEVERKNEETGKMETVEFIKIEVIHNYLYDTTKPKGEGYLECKEIEKDKKYSIFKDTASAEAKKLEGYDYFYEEYQGVIDGFVLYIEGFDLTIDDPDGAIALFNSGKTDTSDVTMYEPNEVYNMTDNLREARAIWKEEAKASAAPLVKTDEVDAEGRPIYYIKEGTVIGKTYKDPDMSGVEIVSRTNLQGDEVNSCTGNGNYMRLILRDLEDAIVEDVETYMNIEEETVVATPQPYQAQEGDLELLANLLHHEGCEAFFTNILGDAKLAADASRVTGYVCINRALLNYGNHGTTIRDQILAPGQYSTAYDVTEGEAVTCEKCLANAEWCLKYDCMSVISPSSNKPMPRNVIGQSGWCQCSSDIGKFNCWWWVDTTKDGEHTEAQHGVSEENQDPYDTFYCQNTNYPEK